MLLSVRLVRDAREVAEATDDLHLIRLERRLHTEGASGPTLTGKAVTDGNHNRIAGHLQPKLPAVTRGFLGSHRFQSLLKTDGIAAALEERRPRAYSRTAVIPRVMRDPRLP